MALRALALVVLLTATGCGNVVDPPVLAGTAGVTTDEGGSPVVLLARCDDREVEVTVHAAVDHEADPDQVNPLLGRWTQVAPGPVARLALADPGPAWEPRAGLAARDGELIVSVAVVGTEDDILTGVSFTRARLESVSPGEVLTNEGVVVAAADLTPECD